jgi:hypothetical protein
MHIFEGYDHQDPIMGKNNHFDIFPRLVVWPEEKRAGGGTAFYSSSFLRTRA